MGLPSAYQGKGWRPREDTHREELAAGALWTSCGLDSEWAPLRKVVLTSPAPTWPTPADWNDVQYLGPVDFCALTAEMHAYADVLRSIGIEVELAPSPAGTSPKYNAIFARDQFFATPEGVILARMASMPRAGEERHVAERLARLGIPILRTLVGRACFEGADALWASPSLVLIGTGNRTNDEGARQVAACLAEQGVSVECAALPSGVQHLLGLLQLVAADIAVVRRDKPVPKRFQSVLEELGYRFIELPDDHEVTAGQAMNFVVTGPCEVVMLADRPHTEAVLASGGLTVHAEVRARELLRAAGGLACATGVLQRDLIFAPPR